MSELPIINVYSVRGRARRGYYDDAIPLVRAAVDQLVREGQLGWGVPATGVLVETLLDRGADGDVDEAEAAIDRLARLPADGGEGLVIREIWLLRLRALLARAHGDEAPLSRIPGSLPRHGENAWLRRRYRVGRGDAMTVGCPFGGGDVSVHRRRGLDPSVGGGRGGHAGRAGPPRRGVAGGDRGTRRLVRRPVRFD